MVALDPRSGKLLVMASSPSYDPNLVENHFSAISKITADCRPAAPLVNRASQGLYPPGSTFKVVTASAALESKKLLAGLGVRRPRLLHGVRQARQQLRHEQPGSGTISLTTALKFSVNSVFCNIGKALGAKRILEQARRFGFYARPPLETPVGERYPSGLYRNGELWYPKRDSRSTRAAWRSGRSACS